MDDNSNARFERIERHLEAHAAAMQQIDQRLDRLTERHQALTESVEILLRIVESHERRLSDLESE